ncbi:MAG: chalcone isomerase family protein [Bdellovibrionaceae bacterium]|nr:chalcone isomerase family protein [Bdellovibrionales bacterium]MCB9084184.1 chalcone isomerase family protein [Pseudobdellovibrionaceae bacterium]
MFWLKTIVSLVAMISLTAQAGEMYGVKMDEGMKVGEKALVLNGMALRKVRKFGIPIKVYIAGLYLEAKTDDSDKILGAPAIKHLEMEFVRTVEKEKITNAWDEAVFKGCVEDCSNYKGPLKEFNAFMGEMRKGQRISVTFYPDKVEVNQVGRTPKKGTIESAAFSKNLLAIFIGPKMFSKEVKESLLGKGEKEDKGDEK